jgi:hypothetical protein
MKMRCLIDGHYGRFLPREFAARCNADDWGISDEDISILLCPDHPEYWDVWADVLNNANASYNNERWYLYQDGDLFAITTRGA